MIRMNSPATIPAHIKCTNCGGCCGVFPVTQNEAASIADYLKTHGEVFEIVKTRKSSPFVCPFRDEKGRKCAIYPARPTICRLFGVTHGMTCVNGNTCEIDGKQFLDLRELGRMINLIDWKKEAAK